MHSQTVKYARNGAFAAIGLYLAVTLPLLGLSMHSGSSIDSGAAMQIASPTLQARR